MTNNVFTAIVSAYVHATIWPQVTSGSGQRGGMFYISGATTPTVSTSNQFKHNYVAHRGGSLSLYST